ncbi:TetR family transcriptional regulator [Streptomyces lunaelactis]|uniref:ScbR family autoregulator-binding transcription factor n=1 Tax=Streptomyces lunaelactis TaxID=1535768 RepID=UPI001584770E|nr:ScbR family autoregulator-binding transcription factor [Streptomyces lunaelactis]NUK02261.1 TetR family transcriptional regulator [Streptomyces lunaelactis]NUK10825.1 TetR family transcriptional regulator [Streptomyces lunaelactis]NUK16125.1 TetR family transcriptional regulator [Streptomyces lunaelactis]NUK22860.1 TetR family transcriptional regulator [Streptomyces lunaelactis]NUK34961.1 TetR family transcriptional regulator [Streptomyces lunaelactis]
MTKQERAVRTRHSLIRSAAEAFQRHGYVQAKLAEISSSAGVSPGALHFHFENKAAVASTVEATAGVTLRRAARLAQHPGMNALQRLTNASHALADHLRRDVVARAGFQLSCDAARRTGLNLRQEWQGCVQQLLAEAADENLLAPHVAQSDMVTAIVAATTGFETLGRDNPEWLSHRSLTGFWRIVLPCLATAEALAGLEPGSTEPSLAGAEVLHR